MQDQADDSKHRDLRIGISGLITAPIGYLVLLFLPVYLEVAAKSLQLNEQQVGWLASTDASGLALATLFFSLCVKRLHFHWTVVVGVAIAVVGNLLSIGMSDFSTLCLIRTITGFGEGLIIAVGVTAVGMTSNPNRWFGFYTAAIVAVQAIGLLVVPPVYQAWSMTGVFLLMVCLYLVPLTVVRLLPRASEAVETAAGQNTAPGSQSTGSQPTGLLLLSLLGLLFFYICIGGVWTYVSFMGTSTGLTLDYVSTALAITMGAGFGGALFFALLGKHGRSHSLLFISVLIMVITLWRLDSFQGGVSYTVILLVYSFFWSVVGARLFGVIADADKSGKFISAAQTVVGLGFMLGPVIASMLVGDFGYSGVLMMGGAALALSFIVITPLALKKPQDEEHVETEGEVIRSSL